MLTNLNPFNLKNFQRPVQLLKRLNYMTQNVLSLDIWWKMCLECKEKITSRRTVLKLRNFTNVNPSNALFDFSHVYTKNNFPVKWTPNWCFRNYIDFFPSLTSFLETRINSIISFSNNLFKSSFVWFFSFFLIKIIWWLMTEQRFIFCIPKLFKGNSSV